MLLIILICKCQLKTLIPNKIVEWIPYNNLQNIEYLTKGGFSEIYTAIWIDGKHEEWDTKLCFTQAKSHITISNKCCFGLKQNPSNGNYMLVMNRININLREYLQQHNNQITWEERINIIFISLYNLHSGNILYSPFNDDWYISDLDFVALQIYQQQVYMETPLDNYRRNEIIGDPYILIYHRVYIKKSKGDIKVVLKSLIFVNRMPKYTLL
ncbi:hypothetical protein RhiirA4_471910 [Rhizophagus irregularis]|uniref:Protein kinase domain-containing protein n=1 Tax=Rhizophagus irregularis TaxID=588596 RepID=A0A2I1H3X6_9GLOM|nr:hypothetical protein RhiirA4_471910 [Rhizophagus irregularis]